MRNRLPLVLLAALCLVVVRLLPLHANVHAAPAGQETPQAVATAPDGTDRAPAPATEPTDPAPTGDAARPTDDDPGVTGVPTAVGAGTPPVTGPAVVETPVTPAATADAAPEATSGPEPAQPAGLERSVQEQAGGILPAVVEPEEDRTPLERLRDVLMLLNFL